MVVRMSNNIVSYNYLSGLNKALYKQTKSMEQIYTERRLNRPSDNPVDTVLDMRYKVNLTENEQYSKNTDMALSWMNTTHDCMNDINEILQKVRDLVVQAAKPNPDVAYEAAAAEIDGLLEQAIQIGNTKLGDRYIFAGQNDRLGVPPFELVPGSPATINYNGDLNRISMVVSPGVANPSIDGVNITGYELFGDGTGTSFLDNMIKIRDELRIPTTPPGATDPVEFLSGEALALLDEDHENLVTTQARLSAKVSMYELGQSLLESGNIRIQSNISDVEDIDVGEASIAFTVAQNAYNAALAMGAKLLPMSLVDFLR